MALHHIFAKSPSGSESSGQILTGYISLGSVKGVLFLGKLGVSRDVDF